MDEAGIYSRLADAIGGVGGIFIERRRLLRFLGPLSPRGRPAVFAVYLQYARQIDDASIARLSSLVKGNTIELMALRGTSITDAAVKYIMASTHIESLDVGETSVSDEGLRDLASLRRLHTLLLDHTRVTDEGLRYLEHTSALRTVSFVGTNTTIRGVRHLYGLRHIRTLWLSESMISDEVASELAATWPGLAIRVEKSDART